MDKKQNAPSAKTLRAELPDRGTATWRDEGKRGMELRGNRNTGVWYHRTRIGGKRVRIRIGKWPDLDCLAARLAVDARLAHLATIENSGGDPLSELRAAKEAKAAIRQAPTLAETLAFEHTPTAQRSYWHSKLAQTKSGDKRRKEILRFLGPFQNQKPGEISPAKLLTHIEAERLRAPAQTNRVLRAIKPMWKWMAESPRLWCNNTIDAVSIQADKTRERDLSLIELARIWTATEQERGIAGKMVRAMMLTAQRRENVAGMTLGQIDRTKMLWNIPASSTKTGTAYTVPLSDEMMGVIDDAIAHTEATKDEALVFPGRDGKFSGFSALQKRLRRNAGIKEHWQFHDFRAALLGRLAENNIPVVIADRCLNHTATQSGNKILRAYLRTELIEERREAFELWAALIRNAVAAAKGGNIITLGVGHA